ncbi:MAG: hypothetical protein FWE23_10840 [Chitinivibrionia bacterium]|nr:hypothetical protein [Chitinivibrionia bacterium]
MNKMKLFFVAIFVVCLAAVSAFAQDIQELRLAVIWNPNTNNLHTPMGVMVGGVNNQPATEPNRGRWEGSVGKDMIWSPTPSPASEIAGAQLRFFLSSIDPALAQNISGSLDNRDLGLTGRDILQGNNALRNVRIWTTNEAPNFSQVIQGFGGQNPNAIVYIGAGADIPEDRRDAFMELFNDAKQADVGILFIGQNSVIDARGLDDTREAFPIQGVQRSFRFRTFGDGPYNEIVGTLESPTARPRGVLVREFNWLRETNDAVWVRADTVLLSGNDGAYQIHLVRNGRRDRLIYDVDRFVNPAEIVSPAPQILHRYGTWSIYAEAVEVIGTDLYDAQMNVGLHVETSVSVGVLTSSQFSNGGTTGDVYLKAESPSLFINGLMVFPTGNDQGFNLSTAHQTHASLVPEALQLETTIIAPATTGINRHAGGRIVAADWFVNAPNPQTGRPDRVLVLRRGQFIENIRHVSANVWHGSVENPGGLDPWAWFQFETGTRINFNAGGLHDLRIVLNNTASEIHRSIFTSPILQGTQELRFRPYGSSSFHNGVFDGRLQAGASIWAFNERVNGGHGPTDFSVLLRPGGSFQADHHYANFLAVQMAGRPSANVSTATTVGRAQFERPQVSIGEFDGVREPGWGPLIGNYFRESELPATSSSRQPFYGDFNDKTFNQLAVVQFNRQRLAIMGYQPTFLEDHERSRAILHDITMWIGFDNYTLPTPNIDVEDYGVPRAPAESGSFIFTNVERAIAHLDWARLTPDMQNRGPHQLRARAQYNNAWRPTPVPSVTLSSSGANEIPLQLGFVDPSIYTADTLIVEAWAEANPASYFGRSGTREARLYFRPLAVSVVNSGNPNEARIDDYLTFTVRTARTPRAARDSVVDGPYNVDIRVLADNNTTQLFPTTGNHTINAGETFAFSQIASLGARDLVIVMRARKEGYLYSPWDTLRIANNPDQCPPHLVRRARWTEGTTYDTLAIEFDEPAFFVGDGSVAPATFVQIIRLWRESDIYIIPVRVVTNGTDNGSNRWVFTVNRAQITRSDGSLVVGFAPAAGDSINLNFITVPVGLNPNVRDEFMNHVDTYDFNSQCDGRPKNPRVPLDLNTLPMPEVYLTDSTGHRALATTAHQGISEHWFVSTRIRELIAMIESDRFTHEMMNGATLHATLIYNGTRNEQRPIASNGTTEIVFSNFGDLGYEAREARSDLDTIVIEANTRTANQEFENSEPIRVRLNFRPLIAYGSAVGMRGDTVDIGTVLTFTVSTEDPHRRILGPEGENLPEDLPYWVDVRITRENRPDTTIYLTRNAGESQLAFEFTRTLSERLGAGRISVYVRARKHGYLHSAEFRVIDNAYNNPDNCPPFITYARLNWGGVIQGDPDGRRLSDTLIVDFNKPIFGLQVNALNNGQSVNMFRLWQNGNPIEFQVSRHNLSQNNRWVFVITSEGFNPRDGDYININVITGWTGENPNIRDVAYNYVGEEPIEGCNNNPLVRLAIERRPISVNVSVVPGKCIAGVTTGICSPGFGARVTPLTLNSIVNDVITAGIGNLIIVDPGIFLTSPIAGATLPEELSGLRGVILDAVGNLVANTDGDQFGIVLSNVGSANPRRMLTIGWTGRNEDGRDVGAGAYMLILDLDWSNNFEVPRPDRHRVAVPIVTEGNR